MKNPLSSKIDILSEFADGHDLFSLQNTYTEMLKYQENWSTVKSGLKAIEKRICAKVARQTYPAYYKRLDNINKKIEDIDKSFLVEDF